MWFSRTYLVAVAVFVVISDIQVNALDSHNGLRYPNEFEAQTIAFREPASFLKILSMDPSDVRFSIYTDTSKPDLPRVITGDDLRTPKISSFDASKPVKILIHGFLSDAESDFPQNVKNAYLEVDKNNTHNVITVDWSKLAKPTSIFSAAYYAAVVENVEDTGVRVGKFIVQLRDEAGLDLRNVHLVGHSLGAHVSGWAGATVYKMTGEKVGRITALDPAGPLFHTDLFTKRIDSTSAVFVDAYHTNAVMLGHSATCGHVDFYLNGGTWQPECSLDLSGSCSHSMCHKIFTQMILEGPSEKSCVCNNAVSYLALPHYCCNAKLALGEYCGEGTTGEFYVTYKYNLAK